MPARVRTPLRRRAALWASAPAAAFGVAAALLGHQLGPVAALVGLAGAVAAGMAVWRSLAPIVPAIGRAGQVAEGTLEPSACPDAPDELAAFTAAIRAVGDRHASTEKVYRADLSRVAAALSALVDPRATPGPLSLSAHSPEAVAPVLAAFDALAKEMAAARQRHAHVYRILNTLPDALIATDAAGAPRYMNPAAEKLFGTASAAAARQPVAALFTEPPPRPAPGADPEPAVAGPAEVVEWVRTGAAGGLTARARSGVLVDLTGGVSVRGPRDVVACLLARDLSAALGREADDRAAVRAAAVRRTLDGYLAESDEPLRQVAAQHRLLAGDAKQSGHRDAMLSRLTTAGEGLRRLETYHALAHWFRAAVWGQTPAGTPAQFMAGEVANLVANRLAGRLKARGNSLRVADQGGWVFADPDRLEAALLGLLTHACDATANSPVELRIHRLAAGDGRVVPETEFHVPDAGPGLPPDVLAVVDRPFGRMAAAPLDQFDGIGGSPLGLVVADRMAASLGGGLRIESEGGTLKVWLTIPARVSHDAPAVTVAVPGALDVAPHDETVNGWRLGTPEPAVTA